MIHDTQASVQSKTIETNLDDQKEETRLSDAKSDTRNTKSDSLVDQSEVQAMNIHVKSLKSFFFSVSSSEPNFSWKITSLTIDHCDETQISFRVFPNLQKLNLIGKYCTSLIVDPKIQLSELQISNIPNSFYMNCSKLKKFTYTTTDSSDYENLCAILKPMRKPTRKYIHFQHALEELYIDSPSIPFKLYQWMKRGDFHALKRITVKVDPKSKVSLQLPYPLTYVHATNLHKLELDDIRALRELFLEDVTVFVTPKGTEELDLDQLTLVGDYDMDYVNGFPHVRSLKLILDECFRINLNHFPQLRSLSLQSKYSYDGILYVDGGIALDSMQIGVWKGVECHNCSVQSLHITFLEVPEYKKYYEYTCGAEEETKEKKEGKVEKEAEELFASPDEPIYSCTTRHIRLKNLQTLQTFDLSVHDKLKDRIFIHCGIENVNGCEFDIANTIRKYNYTHLIENSYKRYQRYVENVMSIMIEIRTDLEHIQLQERQLEEHRRIITDIFQKIHSNMHSMFESVSGRALLRSTMSHLTRGMNQIEKIEATIYMHSKPKEDLLQYQKDANVIHEKVLFDSKCVDYWFASQPWKFFPDDVDAAFVYVISAKKEMTLVRCELKSQLKHMQTTDLVTQLERCDILTYAAKVDQFLLKAARRSIRDKLDTLGDVESTRRNKIRRIVGMRKTGLVEAKCSSRL